jgi:hypothetical protein
MAKSTSGVTDITTLQMALIGFELEKKKIEAKIQEIQAKLKGRKFPLPSAAPAGVAAPKRILSAGARRRIAAAQKKRWAEHRRKKAAAAAQAKQA